MTGHPEGRTSRWSLTEAGGDLVEDGIRRVEELDVEQRLTSISDGFPDRIRAYRKR